MTWGEVPDDRGFVLKIVVQAKTLVRQMLSDHRHIEVGTVATTELRRQPVAQPARFVSATTHLVE